MKAFIKKTFINREYSWLKFNERVLEEAEWNDERTPNPLLEKCKFLSIVTSNLDEFCMVRMGSLFNTLRENPKATESKTGLTAQQQLNGIYAQIRKFYTRRAKAAKSIFAQLKAEGVDVLNVRLKNTKMRKRFQKYFHKTMQPLLNPVVINHKYPFVKLENFQPYVVLHLEKDGNKFFGILPALPAKCDRLIADKTKSGVKLITAEDLTYAFAGEVFPKYKVLSKSLVRLTRNAEFDFEPDIVDDESEFDFSKVLKGKVDARPSLAPVRLEVSNKDPFIMDFLLKNLDLSEKQCFVVHHFFDYKFLFSLEKYMSAETAARLKYPPFKQRIIALPNPESVIESVRKKDIMLSYPFDSMSTYLDLLDEASVDPRVADIKITLYRTDKQSRVVEALRRAVRNGKDVTVLVEITARFDEENNLHVANVLKEAGCNVSYGFGNYKVHSKITLIILKEGEDISYITHLGTGNYNEGTSRIYTDLNVITANREIGEDGADFFRKLSTGNKEMYFKHLLVAPHSMRAGFMQKIKEQIELAEQGKPALIICKMNSLTDAAFIKEFIRASCAGVKIQLIVRGICCLLPGVAGRTENITVKSIVGRFLEHTRAYCFGVENPAVYISSADIMTRNLSRRVEIAAPILDPSVRDRVMHMMHVQLADKEKSSYLGADGKYYRYKDEHGPSSQQYFMDNEH